MQPKDKEGGDDSEHGPSTQRRLRQRRLGDLTGEHLQKVEEIFTPAVCLRHAAQKTRTKHKDKSQPAAITNEQGQKGTEQSRTEQHNRSIAALLAGSREI